MGHRTLRLCGLLLLSAAMACTSQPDAASGQEGARGGGDRPAIAGWEDWKTDFGKATVPLEEITSGGPPRDGIPAIDAPKFVSVGEADRWLDDREPVAVVRRADEVKAYPLQILIWHEIVNDVVGGSPVSVTFCPLCNTTLAFDRNFDGRVLDFGTTGRLRHSDLVMYDRQTHTWWQQATGEGIVGLYAGEQLTFVPTQVVRWADVKTEWPEAKVLSRETGYDRPYGNNPYRGYDSGPGPIQRFFQFGRRDRRLEPMERVVALEHGGEALALPFSRLAERRVAEVEVGGRDVVVFWAPGTASALDDGSIARGRDVGTSAAFEPVVDGRRLHFEPAGDGRFRDRETGTVWSITGRALEGELAGRQLTEVVHGNHFWFAWGTFRPETKIWNGR